MSKENVNTHSLGVGSRVLVGKEFDKHGVIKFIGPTTFSEVQGDWIGICLDTPDGKNNGSHSGVSYFEADENHGLFVKNWFQVRPEAAEAAKPLVVRSSVRTSISTTSREKPVLKTEQDTKSSSSAAIAANKEKLAALREKRSQIAAATAANVSPNATTRIPLNSTKVDVPVTPKRMSLSTSRSETFTTPAAASEGLALSGKQFPSMCAQDFLDIKTPGKENPLIEMMQASIYKLTKQEDEHVVQITEQNLTIFNLQKVIETNASQIEELSATLERATAVQASSDVVIDSLQATVNTLESSLFEKTSALERVSKDTEDTVATLTNQLEAATQQVQLLIADNSQSSALDSLQQTVDRLSEKDLQAQVEITALKATFAAQDSRSTEDQQLITQLQAKESVAQAALITLEYQLNEIQISTSAAQEASNASLIALQQEVSSLQAHERDNQIEINTLRASVHTLSEADSSGMCIELQHTIDELHDRETETNGKLVDLQSKLAAQQTEIMALHATVIQMTTDARNSGNASIELQRVIDEARVIESDLSSQLTDLQATNDQKTTEIIELTAVADGLRAEVASAEERVREMSLAVEELHLSQDSALAREDQYLADIERLESELQDANQQIAAATEGGSEISELQSVVDALRLKLSDGNQMIAKLQRSLQDRVEDVESRDSQLLELNERNKVDTEHIASLNLRLVESQQLAVAAAVAQTTTTTAEEALRVQVEELSDSLEMLAMDKEQLLMDNELLEEKVLSLQTDLDVYAQGGTGADGPSNAQLSIETHKLQASLARMQEMSVEDKELISTQAALLEELELECGDLRAYRDQASSDLAEMRGAVDGMSSYEEMIEQLTEQNLDLSAQLTASRQLVSDLEESVELNEELDARQTQQISDDRKVIDTLNVTMSAYDRQLAERDVVATDLVRQLDKLKHTNKGLQAEVQLLKDTIQLDSLESRTVESKLRDVALMKTQQELLAQEVNTLYNQCIAANAQKFRFQALFVRMDAIFGSSSFYLEESKLVNTEVVFVSTMSTGLDALRLVSSLTTLVTNGGVAVELQDCGVRNVKMFVSLYLLLLRAQYFAIQSGVSLFRDGDDVCARSRVQKLMSVKALFERVAHLALKITEINSRAAAKNNSARDRALDSANESHDDREEVGDQESEDDFAATSSVELQQQVAFNDLAAALTGVMDELQALSVDGGEENDAEWSFGEQDSGAVPLAQVEMNLLALNAVVDLASFLCQDTADVGDLATPRSAKKQSRSDLSVFSVLEQLKSVKMELKSATFSLKQNGAHYVQYTTQLEDCCLTLQRGFLTGEENVQDSVKATLTSLRSINSGLSARANSANIAITIGVSGVLRYFPLILMTNIATSVGAQRQQEEAALREQFTQHSEKYWNLLIQNNSDLLLSVGGGEAVTPSKNGTEGPPSSRGEVSWKGRVAELRKIVSGRLGSAPAPVMSPKKGASSSSFSSSPRDEAYFLPQLQQVAAEQHAAVVNELDLKKDELKSALRQCHELQSLHEAAIKTTLAVAQNAHQEEVGRLRGEMRVMEEALKSTENRADAVEKEARLIRNNHSQSMANVHTPPPKAAETRADRLARRQSQADMHDASKGASSLSALLASVGESQATGSVQHHAHDSSAQYQLLLDQVSHWRRVAMKRLTQSLVPLPELDVLSALPVDIGNRQELPVEYPPGNTVRQPNAFSVHNIELVGYDVDRSSTADYTALYRKIRLLRASSVRIRPIGGVQSGSATQQSGGDISRSEALRNRIKAKTNVIYRVSSAQ